MSSVRLSSGWGRRTDYNKGVERVQPRRSGYNATSVPGNSDGAGIPATSAACVTPGSRSEEQAGPRGDEDGGVAQRQSRGLISPWSEVRVLSPPPPPEPERPRKT